MAFNVSALIDGAKAVAGHPITKGGALASLISGGLYAATIAGVAIPAWALTAGPLAGYVVYRLLPKKTEDQIDAVAAEVVAVATEIPTTYADPDKDFPTGKNGDESKPQASLSNIDKG